MKKLILLICLLFSLNSFSQVIVDLGWHKIEVPDTLTKETVERFDYYMRTNPINYEKYLREIKTIKKVDEDRYFVGKHKRKDVIFINSRLDQYPNTKKIVILHYLAINNGAEPIKNDSPYVLNTAFNITERNEEMFRRQIKYESPYKAIIRELKEESPLRSKL